MRLHFMVLVLLIGALLAGCSSTPITPTSTPVPNAKPVVAPQDTTANVAATPAQSGLRVGVIDEDIQSPVIFSSEKGRFVTCF